MGWGLRKSFSLGKFFRLSVTKNGVGASVGVPGLRVGVGSDGKVRRTVSLPGAGIYNTEVIAGASKKKPSLCCPGCGHTLRKADRFCSACGRRV